MLTQKQELALQAIVEKYQNHEKYVVIGGYAGSGKSYLVKFAIAALEKYGIHENKVCYAAYTGKACQVLLSKGNKNVSTLHKLMYESIPKPDGTFFRRKKVSLGYDVIVADECSMIPKPLMENLLSYPVFVIFLGDPGQLPPVDKDADNHLLDHPDVFLDQIMRQALDSEIIQLSMKIRHLEPITYYQGKDVIVLPKKQLNTGHLLWADQILCATNATRTTINTQMRDLLGHKGRPQDGDKVICSRNYWDNIAVNEDPLVNGTIGFLKNTYETKQHYPKYLYPKQDVRVLGGEFISDTGADFGNLNFDEDMILTGEPSVDWKSAYKISKNARYRGTLPYEFLYGYAITTHRAQGSEFPKVLIIEEKFPFDEEEHARWLYTAVTRGSKKVVLVR